VVGKGSKFTLRLLVKDCEVKEDNEAPMQQITETKKVEEAI
jgi:hypothetical protein